MSTEHTKERTNVTSRAERYLHAALSLLFFDIINEIKNCIKSKVLKKISGYEIGNT